MDLVSKQLSGKAQEIQFQGDITQFLFSRVPEGKSAVGRLFPEEHHQPDGERGKSSSRRNGNLTAFEESNSFQMRMRGEASLLT